MLKKGVIAMEAVLTFNPDGFVLEHGRGLSSSRQRELFGVIFSWFDDHLPHVQHLSLIESTPDKLIVQVQGSATWRRIVNAVLRQKLGTWFDKTISWKTIGTGR